MNSINHTLNGLASSLLLNVGLTSIAEKFDPVQNQNGKAVQVVQSANAAEGCVWICNFTPEAGE